MKLSYFSYDFWECCCVAPLVFRAPEGPAAREARASLRSAPRPVPTTAHGHRSQAHHDPAVLASSPHTPHSCAHTQFRMQFPHDYFKL